MILEVLEGSMAVKLKRKLLHNISSNRQCRSFMNVMFARSSRPEVFCKKGALINFTRFTGKHLCQSLFFNKLNECSQHNLPYFTFSKFLFY